ncbi:hypothetical protein RI845_08140 [Thalassotalea nanhaiensis]|uniref:HlyD family secretion protein n=1 Tax=Thalassotalea nanhaiensis TaxID=3065648 RepID=A0ABY9TMJ9_9GAMM|nr:hypothetical protein RI845_08140 [Colwelliaceae bacterium SQ345]
MKIQFQSEKQKNATLNDGFKVVYAPAKRIAFKIRWYVLLSIIASPLVIFSWHMLDDTLLVTADGILTTEPIVLNAPKSVYVENINISAGDKISERDVLIKLNSPVVDKELILLTKKYSAYKAHHESGNETINRLYAQQIATLKSAEKSQDKINEKYQEYNSRGVLPLNEQLLIEQNSLNAKSKYQQAMIEHQSALDEHKNGQAAKTLMEIELAMVEAKAKQDMLAIRSNKEAVVNEVFVEEGEFIAEDTPLLAISNLVDPVVNVYLSPERMDYAKVGQTATITLPNGDEHHGVINTPTQLSQKMPDVLSGPFDGNKPAIKVTLDISPKPEVVLEGLPVKVRFHYLSET